MTDVISILSRGGRFWAQTGKTGWPSRFTYIANGDLQPFDMSRETCLGHLVLSTFKVHASFAKGILCLGLN